MQDASALQSYYTLVYDQQLSSCGKYLAACDSFGHIGVFRLELAGLFSEHFGEGLRSAYSLARVLSPSVIGTGHRTPLNYWQGGLQSLYFKSAPLPSRYLRYFHEGSTGPVYCLESGGSLLFSGGTNGAVKCWKWSDVTDKVGVCFVHVWHLV